MANEPLGKVLPEWEIEGMTWTNTTLLHRLVISEDLETLRSRKSEITPEIANLTCAVEEDTRHHLSQVSGFKNSRLEIPPGNRPVHGVHAGSRQRGAGEVADRGWR